MPKTGDPDEAAADELLIYIDNDPALYERKKYAAKNLIQKMAKKTYDHKRAPDIWMYIVEDGAKRYAKEFASSPRDWSSIFSVSTRKVVAKELADRWYENAKAGRPDEV